MTPPFSIDVTTHYERFSDRLMDQHLEFENISRRARDILCRDPYNRTRTHRIKKLKAVPFGEGQWRLSLGRFRFRYDIHDKKVVLQYCSLRREDTYR